jgi:hypothetical protein
MITEEMYLLAKQVVANYELQLNIADVMSRNYTYSDMKKSFVEGTNRGCYIASVIQGKPIDKFDEWDEFVQKHYGT